MESPDVDRSPATDKPEEAYHNDTYAPIRTPRSRSEAPGQLSQVDSRGPAISTRSLSRVRSQNGYGCDDDDSASEDVEMQGDAEKDPYQVAWDGGDADPENPRSMPKWRKWMIVVICSFSSVCVTNISSIYTSTYDQTTVEFGVSPIVATLGLSLFVFGLGLSPMFLGPLSEFFGRRPVYIVSLLMTVIWLIPSAAAQNIQTMLVARFFDGMAGSAFLSVSGGTVGDMFNRNELQGPMMIFSVSPFLGPSLGPLIGGFINQYASWRWTYYVLIIWAGVMWLLIMLLVPETYHPVLLRNKARRLRKETGDERWKAPIEKTDKSVSKTLMRSLYRPFLLLILEPMVLNLCLFSAILLGTLYLFFGAFALIFSDLYGFDLSQTGLSFLGLMVGMVIAVTTDPFWHKNYQRLVRNREAAGGEPGGSEPEFRLPPAIVGAPLVTIGLFWFAWTTYSSVHWIVPILGSMVFATGMVLVFSGVFTYLVDAYPLYAASALAANSFTRSSFAGAFPLFGDQMYEKLGYQWATSLLGFLTVAMLPFPYLFFRYGKRIRKSSRYAKST